MAGGSPRALKAEIGYVPQESFLFSDTIGSNLVYGARDGHAAPWAAAIAQLATTIEDQYVRRPDHVQHHLGVRRVAPVAVGGPAARA